MQSSRIYLFSPFLEKFSVKINTGLKRDQQIQLDHLDLYEYNGVYFPEKNYFNCDLMPIEWLEIYESKEKILELLEKVNVPITYTPNVIEQHLNFTIEANSFYDKTIV